MANNYVTELEGLKKGYGDQVVSLTDRLNQLDQFSQGTATDQLSKEKPKGYNPMNTLKAWFNMTANRKNLESEIGSARSNQLDIIKSLYDISQSGQSEVDPLDQIIKTLQAKKLAQELGQDIDFETGNVTSSVGKKPLTKEEDEVVKLTKELLEERDTDAVTGMPNLLKELTGENRTTRRTLEQLSSKLQLAIAKQLKGQGQMSNFEREIIAQAATKLKWGILHGLPNEELTRELKNIYTTLTGEEYGVGAQGEQGGGLLDEEDEALINKYKNAGK